MGFRAATIFVTYTEIREKQKLKSHEGGFLSDSDLGVSWDLEGR